MAKKEGTRGGSVKSCHVRQRRGERRMDGEPIPLPPKQFLQYWKDFRGEIFFNYLQV